jgi:hypothetical protein
MDFSTCCPILSLTFSRHGSRKFAREVTQHSESNLWQVLGKYDLLRVEGLNSLDELFPTIQGRTRPDAATGTTAAQNGIVLVPFDDFLEKLEGEDKWRDGYLSFLDSVSMPSLSSAPSRVNSSSAPFLYMAQFTLTPAAHQYGEDYRGILDLMNQSRRALAALYESHSDTLRKVQPAWDLISLGNIFLFRSLAASDVAIIALPKDPHQLFSLMHFTMLARTLTLSAIAQGELPGHAFAHVEETVAFRDTLPLRAQWGEQERWWQMSLQTDVMVDSGHEHDVSEKLRNAANQHNLSAPQIIAVAGIHSLRIVQKNLSAFDTIWASKVRDLAFRVESLVDSTSSVAVKPPEIRPVPDNSQFTTSPQRAWRITEEFDADLRRIENDVLAWADEITGLILPEQKRELANLLSLFRNAFYRLETATAARDLLPFMRQLSACCRLRDEWAAFWNGLDRHTAAAEIRADVVQLLSHLCRAFQNRLEPRYHEADPTVYRTLEQGVSKAVHAYTTAYWINSEVLERLQGGQAVADSCGACHIGVCLAIGSSGRVYFREIFNLFRDYVLEKRQHNRVGNVLGGQTSQTMHLCWSAPLVLLDVSGHLLLQPELNMVNSLHETLLFSDWILADRNTKLREAINRASLHCVSNVLRYLYRGIAVSKRVEGASENVEEKLRNRLVVKMSRLLQKSLQSCDPRRYLHDMAEGVSKHSVFHDALKGLSLLLPREDKEVGSDEARFVGEMYEDISPDSLSEICDAFQLTISEGIADKIKVAVLVSLLGDRELCVEPTINGWDVLRILDSLCLGTRESLPSSTPDEKSQLDERHRAVLLMVRQWFELSENITPSWLSDRFLELSIASASPDVSLSVQSDKFLPVWKSMCERMNLRSWTPAEKSVLRHYLDTLCCRKKASEQAGRESLVLTLSRINFLLHLWAKSCRIGATRMLERI